MRRVTGVLVLLVVAACGVEGSTPGSDGLEEPLLPPTTSNSEANVSSTNSSESTGGEGQSATSTSVPNRGTPYVERVPTSQSPVTGEVPADLIAVILADAENRTGVAAGDWTVIRSEAVVWSDGSLGCPEPGMAYTQAEVPGYWVEIAASSAQLDYRADDRGNFRVCEKRVESPAEGSLPGDSVGPPTTSPNS